MQIDKLVTMANQIGSFFAAMPDHQEALDGIANHLKKFWDPRMRRELLAHMDATAESGLAPLVLEAIGQHREQLR
ncbi:formate dehydrogenase subunit delta [Pelomonas sp. SE-A7]|uniref:formate dehydrogenase subunit delta n=1 Tax=Pelomonas sp. SE-A7 TaxID=3054953 RepID=UPI00259CBBD3|nr:formate dehydrogenase subunit delta [Pelomonas sp. SE-A7]MDM4768017.1 formate dehydrogenase subunit delta [Pelomonas sp. SE-A7]